MVKIKPILLGDTKKKRAVKIAVSARQIINTLRLPKILERNCDNKITPISVTTCPIMLKRLNPTANTLELFLAINPKASRNLLIQIVPVSESYPCRKVFRMIRSLFSSSYPSIGTSIPGRRSVSSRQIPTSRPQLLGLDESWKCNKRNSGKRIVLGIQ